MTRELRAVPVPSSTSDWQGDRETVPALPGQNIFEVADKHEVSWVLDAIRMNEHESSEICRVHAIDCGCWCSMHTYKPRLQFVGLLSPPAATAVAADVDHGIAQW